MPTLRQGCCLVPCLATLGTHPVQATRARMSDMMSIARPLPPLASRRLLDQVRERTRYLHYSIRTEDAYVYWVRAFVHFHGLKHPKEMGASEVEGFLSHLANDRQVAASTHKQALSALIFLFDRVLGCLWCSSPQRCRRCWVRWIHATSCWAACCMAPACG